jgi:hypothetical protein
LLAASAPPQVANVPASTKVVRMLDRTRMFVSSL